LFRLLAFVVAVLVTAGCASRATRDSARLATESEIRLAEHDRFEGMMKQDVVALDSLLDDDLTYVHTGGDLQTKAQFPETIRSKSLVYESISPSEVQVHVHDGLAIATGVSAMRVRSAGASAASSFGIRFTEAFVHRNGRWLLTAWEATRRAP
jgi:hypothetical protein